MNILCGSSGPLIILLASVIVSCGDVDVPTGLTALSGAMSGSPSDSSDSGSGSELTSAGHGGEDGSPSTSTTDVTESATTDECMPGDEGCSCNAGSCDADLVCIDDVCQAPLTCDAVDLNEPNDNEASAVNLGGLGDDDDDGGSLFGVLETPEDVDWYRYVGNDNLGSIVDPARILTATGGLRLCKFFECLNGLAATEPNCPAGTQTAVSMMARPGCCSSTGFEVGDLNCTGTIDDSALVLLRLDQAAEVCVEYSLDYHF